jgi:hypothetical protein
MVSVTTGMRELLVAISGSGGALTGLLFVAMSVTPRRQILQGPRIIHQVRAAAAILSFVNALAVSLFALVPGTNIGYPAIVFGVVGIAFTAASVRSIVTSSATPTQEWHQLSLMLLLLAIFGTEFIAGVLALGSPDKPGPQETIGYALVGSLIVGISRAWEFVGDIDTGLTSSLAVLLGIRRTALPRDSDEAGPDGSGPDEPPAAEPPTANQPDGS